MPRALSEIAQVNPQVNLPAGAVASTPVSFVPMSDVTEFGDWVGHQVRKLGEVRNGFTGFADGDVLVAKITPCFENGKGAHVVGLTNGIGFGSTEFHVLRARDGVSPRYVHHVTQSARLRKAAEAYMSGSAGQRRVPREFFDAFNVPDLSPQEQYQIGVVLDTLDSTIRRTEAIIEKLKLVKQGLLHDLLTRGIDANGELRPPQSKAPHLYKDSPLGRIPRDWLALGLADMETPNRSVLRTGPFGSSLKGEHLTETGRPVVTIGSLGVGRFLTDELLYVSEATAQVLADFELLPGDIAFSRVADVGRSVVVGEAERGWIMSSNFMRISVDSSRVLPEFLQAQLAYDSRVKQQVRSTVNSAGRDVASSAILMSLRFAVPELDEQLKLTARVRAMEDRITAEERLREKMQAERSGLMDDLLTGRVRVTPLLT